MLGKIKTKFLMTKWGSEFALSIIIVGRNIKKKFMKAKAAAAIILKWRPPWLVPYLIGCIAGAASVLILWFWR